MTRTGLDKALEGARTVELHLKVRDCPPISGVIAERFGDGAVAIEDRRRLVFTPREIDHVTVLEYA